MIRVPRSIFKQLLRESEQRQTGNGGKQPRGARVKRFQNYAVGWGKGWVSITIPLELHSHKSAHDAWYTTAKRTAHERRTVAGYLLENRGIIPGLPVVVTLTRLGPKELDKFDNLRLALSATTDAIASFFDISDNDARIDWRHEQQPGMPYGVAIRVERRA